MYVCPALIPYPESSELMKPTQRAFNYPSMDTKTASMRLATLGNHWQDMLAPQLVSEFSRVIPTISIDLQWSSPRSAWLAFHRRDGLHQGPSLGHIMSVGSSNQSRQWNTLSISNHVMLTACFSPVCGVGSCLIPPKTARTEALSSDARLQSIPPEDCRHSRITWWISSHTPTSCQSLSLLQHVMPEPQPISWGKSSQPMPVLSTNKMPVSACLSGILGRPPLGLEGSGGNNGSISSHSSSVNRGFAITISSPGNADILNPANKFC